ncbi:MAG: 50S ribosomal protein L5 [Deltaproteobacteria bacterium RIFCSPLOWO2_02_FULL_44_10]|nr:MAG: 50S ribosomal protein L5 [Deltaproteobacteria bacterium RIFCSPHIGHO2_02_FULL_44_16]OGQ45577.1 MAG: 50S ribosomal protein L5 [Deltaproteobacteria bacterium RIFCSPLOWO2_02_FULL_44_10]
MAKEKTTTEKREPSTFEEHYRKQCVPQLKEKFNYKNVMEVPRVQKVVVNTCLKESLSDVKILEAIAEELAVITGQRPVYTLAKKSIANFKLRKGQKIGACVTLRKRTMYDFLNRLFNVALPRVRDFKGVSPKAFDGRGNYTIGVTEQIIFPEIHFDKVNKVAGMNITIVTNAKTNEEGRALLEFMGMPFRK